MSLTLASFSCFADISGSLQNHGWEQEQVEQTSVLRLHIRSKRVGVHDSPTAQVNTRSSIFAISLVSSLNMNFRSRVE